MTFEEEKSALQARYYAHVTEAEARCADTIASPLAPSQTYRADSPYAAEWDNARRHNREAKALEILKIELETLDRIFLSEFEVLENFYEVST